MPGFLLARDHSLSMVSSCAAKHRCAPVLARISSGVTPGAIAVTVRQPGLQSMMHSSVTIVFTQPGAVSGSEQTIDRLHKHMTKAEARLADNGSEQTVDRLHRSMSRFDLRTA